MTEFNPYNKWFGISKDEDSPTHYQILGLKRGEFDPDVIEAAAEQRTLFLDSIRDGDNKELARKLSKEVKLAKLTLLDPQKRDAHDLEISCSFGMSTERQPSSVKQTQTASNPPTDAVATPVSKKLSVSTPPTVSTPPRFLQNNNTIDHLDPPQNNVGTQDNLLPKPSHSSAPTPPLPKHLLNSVISQTPKSQQLGLSAPGVSPSSSPRNAPKQTGRSETESIVVSADQKTIFSPSLANRTKTKRDQKTIFGQVAMLFVPTILIIILVTVFPKSFDSLVQGIRDMLHGKDSVASPK